MSYRVPRGILAEAKRCPNGYACLSQKDGRVCKAQRLIPGDGVFIPGKEEVDCPYAEKTSGGIACSCPVRIELFRTYGL